MQRLHLFIFRHIFLFHAFVWFVGTRLGVQDDVGRAVVSPVLGAHLIINKIMTGFSILSYCNIRNMYHQSDQSRDAFLVKNLSN